MADVKPRWIASGLMDVAFNAARVGHSEKSRKNGHTPYLGHVMAVSALVIEHGGTEVQAAAALLHDLLEDTEITYSHIAGYAGHDVAEIVRHCSDTENKPFPDRRTPDEKLADWIKRKESYLARLEAAPSHSPFLLVSLADKVHNAEQTARDIESVLVNGCDIDSFWSAFNAPRKKQHWWYSSLYLAFAGKEWHAETTPLVERFDRAVQFITAN